MIRLATDVGGTFTDLVGYDEKSGKVFTSKSLTTPQDQSIGVLDVIDRAESASGLDTDKVRFFAHGGTTVINAITERKGVRTALVTTEGFRDVLEIGRGNRPDLYNLQFHSPEPFIPRKLRAEVRERVGADGRVIEPLNEDDVREAARLFVKEGVEAVAVIFLHSYAHPEHEKRCAALLRELMPDVTVCASHEISRQWREYERTNTVALNAYVQPIIQRYFANLEKALAAKGVYSAYYAMLSNGGVATFSQAVASPLTLVESGPSGGAAGAARIGAILGEKDVLYLDVGGTTAKCTLIRDGKPNLDAEYKLEWARTFPGYPVQVPVVDIVEIGSGGGSIAWIDAAGGLRVGPKSAGSSPGPACYGLGGTEPTVTDAKVAIGLLNPAAFAEGAMTLDVELARQAITRLAGPLGLSVDGAAQAIIDVAESNMINALKLVTVQRGHDPRDLALIVSGGAGPMLGARLGRELNAKSIIIPPHSGIFSAWGMLAAHPRADIRKTWFSPLVPSSLGELARLFADMEGEALSYFELDDKEGVAFSYGVEMRYHGQEHSVSARFSPSMQLADFAEAFHLAHETAYSFRLPDARIEVTNLHLQAEIAGNVIDCPPIDNDGRTVARARKGERNVYFGNDGGWKLCAVYDRNGLPCGERLSGPLLVEEPTTTTLVHAGQVLEVTDRGIMVITEEVR
ncbi:hydantoinase/oxoprolinase family protein [Aminobacter sp. LjRoot7]|uniref:hydantoinase/oxoprolinase family protein n=1 Tax=Aminobacter sp. LjRoot7 TaxID=3342335 RepID=UPI003ECFF8D8